jgi:hypothetical protein
MHTILRYIYSTNIYSLLRVEESELHVRKIEDCSHFATNPSKTLKQITHDLHLTINEKVTS